MRGVEEVFACLRGERIGAVDDVCEGHVGLGEVVDADGGSEGEEGEAVGGGEGVQNSLGGGGGIGLMGGVWGRLAECRDRWCGSGCGDLGF